MSGERPERARGKSLIWLFVGLVGVLPVMYAVAVWFGALNQDEGWYLYAGRLVADGKRPFVDFASTQGPLMAYIYALAQPLVTRWGVLGGRIFTALLGVAAILVAMRLAFVVAEERCDDGQDGKCRLIGVGAALLTGALLGGSLYQVYFTSIVKTYSVAGLFVLLGFLGLQCGLRKKAGKWQGLLGGAVAGGCFALASGVRLSAGILLPAVWLALVWQCYRDRNFGRRNGFAALIGMLLGGTVLLVAIYVPFMLAAPEAVKFGLLEYHAGREVGSAGLVLAYKCGFLLRLAGAYFPLLCAGVAAIWLWVVGQKVGVTDCSWPGTANAAGGIAGLLLTGFVAVTAVHLAADFPYDDYQVFIMPVAVVAVAALLAPWVSHSKFGMLLVMLLILAHSISSPLLQSWLLAPRDRIWWPLRRETALQRLGRAAMDIRKIGGFSGSGCDTLLTQDTYLAIESGARVPQGMELGPFCYFPDMERSRAEACHVLNRDMLREVLRTSSAPVAAFSGYGLAIRCPEVMPLAEDERAELWQIVEMRYSVVTNIAIFGQADTTLRILKCKKDE